MNVNANCSCSADAPRPTPVTPDTSPASGLAAQQALARQEEARRQEEAKRKAEDEARQKKFIADRNAAVGTLKGVQATPSAAAGGLKDVGPAAQSINTLKPIAPPDTGGASANSIRDARVRELDTLIARDIEAIRRLGFSRRAEDFVAWEQLAADGKREFEGEVSDAITGAIVDKAQGEILEAFKTFDEASAAKLVARLRAEHPSADATELFALIERLGRVKDKELIAADAEEVVKRIDQLRAVVQTPNDRIEIAKLAASLLEGLVEDPRLKFLITEIKITSAALYNNASRRVAMNEVDRLTSMTEKQLVAMNKLQAVLNDHVRERARLAASAENRLD